MQGDKRRWTTSDDVLDAYSDMVYRLAFAYARNRVDADDIYQNAFLQYYRKPRVFESEGHRKAWLIRVTINCAKKHLSSAHPTLPLDTAAEQAMFDCPNEVCLDEALRKLKPKYRAVIHLFYYEDCSVADIAGSLRLTASHVRTLLTRARNQLKELLKDQL